LLPSHFRFQPVLLGFGANLGDRRKTIESAWQTLAAHAGIKTVRLSRMYETEPVGGPDGQPLYLNAAGIVQTILPPVDLLRVLQQIEAGYGRIRTEHWGPRTLDIDILLYADKMQQDADLTIPHPEMLHRRFVLEPANEIAPDWIHPVTRNTLQKHWKQIQQTMSEKNSLDKSPERIRQMFDAVAPRYDFLNHLLSLGIDRHWRWMTARKLLNPQTIDGDVLDVCCGTGDLSIAFLKRKQYALNRHFYGIDFSTEMLERAVQKTKRFPQVRFSAGDAVCIPFETGRFAVAAVSFGLRNVCDPQRTLAEMVRVCKPGGTVAVLEFSTPVLPVVKQCYGFYFRFILPLLGQMFVGIRSGPQHHAYRYLPDSVFAFDCPEKTADRLRQLGVSAVRIFPMTFGIASLTLGTIPR
jgi:demethylmenaquinone methyltransferase/2-methoxy-6-polyprenyl-1,4-benzoquinol methylase